MSEMDLINYVGEEAGKLFFRYYLYKQIYKNSTDTETKENVMKELRKTQLVTSSFQGESVVVSVTGNDYSVLVHESHKELGLRLGSILNLFRSNRTPPGERRPGRWEVLFY